MKLPIDLGETPDGKRFKLPLNSLRRHFLALGGTGSGKTVLCKAVVEECIRYNLPVIAIDLQGDILSLANMSTDMPEGAVSVSDVTRAKYAERADVKIWTPGSSLGIPLSFAPDMSIPADASPEDRIMVMDNIATSIANMLDGGKDGTVAGFYTILHYADRVGLKCRDFNHLDMFLADPPADLKVELDVFWSDRARAKLRESLRIKGTGVGSLLYGMGQGIDVDELFGLKVPGPANEGRARISVIYLAHLNEARQQEFLALLFGSMYRWMLSQGDYLSGLLYMDEIAPFCPPVKKPPAKKGLMLLLRQARKYGLCTVLATQSPGDLDYKALGQIGTVALGKMTQRQDIAKVGGLLNGFAGVDAEAIVEALPGAGMGQFVVINADHLDGPTPVQGRWLATEHKGPVEAERILEMVSDTDRATLG